jgi:hypothetical protein
MGNKNISGTADKTILILGASGKTKLLQEIINKKDSTSNVEIRKSFTEQILLNIQRITKEVIKILQNEHKETYKKFEKLLTKFESSEKIKETTKTISKIWNDTIFEIFQKNESFKEYHSFLTKKTLERISKANYIPSVEDVDFCLTWKTLGTQHVTLNHGEEEIEFIHIGNESNWKQTCDMIIYLVSMGDLDDKNIHNFEKISQNAKGASIMVVFTNPEEMREKVFKTFSSDVPSFIGKLIKKFHTKK